MLKRRSPLFVFSVVPLCVPGLIALLGLALTVLSPSLGPLALFAVVISALFTYAGVIAFGIPAYLFLRSVRAIWWWTTAVLGGVIAVLVWAAFGIWFSHGFGPNLYGQPWGKAILVLNDQEFQLSLIGAGLIGVLVGLVIWAMIRETSSAEETTERMQ